MITGPMVDELLTRCLESIQCFQKNRQSRQANEIMRAEVSQIAREVFRWRLTGETKAELFLRPMETRLVDQFGPRTGRRLYWQFLEAFWLPSLSDSGKSSTVDSRSIDVIGVPTRF